MNINGFSGPITPCSADPETEGYIGIYDGRPFHVHADHTPVAWDKLKEAIADGRITPEPFAPAVMSLDEARAAAIAKLKADFLAAQTAPIHFTTKAGYESHFARDDLTRCGIAAIIKADQQAWKANVWLDANDLPVSPFAFEDVLSLGMAIDTTPTPDYATLMTRISAVMSAKKLKDIAAVTL